MLELLMRQSLLRRPSLSPGSLKLKRSVLKQVTGLLDASMYVSDFKIMIDLRSRLCYSLGTRSQIICTEYYLKIRKRLGKGTRNCIVSHDSGYGVHFYTYT